MNYPKIRKSWTKQQVTDFLFNNATDYEEDAVYEVPLTDQQISDLQNQLTEKISEFIHEEELAKDAAAAARKHLNALEAEWKAISHMISSKKMEKTGTLFRFQHAEEAKVYVVDENGHIIQEDEIQPHEQLKLAPGSEAASEEE